MSVYIALLARPGARALAIALARPAGSRSQASRSRSCCWWKTGQGSFAVAGLAVSDFAAGAGALAPLRGRLIDRRGAAALLWLAAAYTAASVLSWRSRDARPPRSRWRSRRSPARSRRRSSRPPGPCGPASPGPA